MVVTIFRYRAKKIYKYMKSAPASDMHKQPRSLPSYVYIGDGGNTRRDGSNFQPKIIDCKALIYDIHEFSIKLALSPIFDQVLDQGTDHPR